MDINSKLETELALIRVVLVEDHALMRVELVDLLEADGRFAVVGSAQDWQSAKQLAMEVQAEVLLLDLQLPDGDGLDLISHFKAAQPNIKVVVLTVHQDASHAVRAVAQGVDAYLMKDDVALPNHIADTIAGNHPLDPRVTGHLISRLTNVQPSDGLELTRREQQTLAGLQRGLSYAELAEHMNISVHTVPGYIKSLYRKLEVTSRSQAVYRATQLGILSSV